MTAILSARAYANDQVVFLAWTLTQKLDNCLGFEITRIYVTDGDEDTPVGSERVLASWVPFEKQDNPKWLPQNTSVWPVQMLTWRDLTVRRRRDHPILRRPNVTLKYRVRPLAAIAPGLEPVTNLPSKTYDGDLLPLAYLDEGCETNEVVVTNRFGDLFATFNNGILSTQWLSHVFEARMHKPLTKGNLMPLLAKPGDKFRTYMSGDVLGLLRELLDRATGEPGANVYMALYELTDKELVDLIHANASCVHLILSNTGLEKTTGEWDTENAPARVTLAEVAELHHRMFNNNAHIGHNKFVVLVGADGIPRAVLTGSTNWTPNGLCAQSNNAILIEDPTVAGQYLGYWNDLKVDTDRFVRPQPLSNPTHNVQGLALRSADASVEPSVTLAGNTSLTFWRSPNTIATSKGTRTPPDLAAVFSLMRKAKKSIFFAVFMPSVRGDTSIIEQAIAIGRADPSLLVYGAVSDARAMPNYSEKKNTPDDGGENSIDKTPSPATFDEGNVHVVRASALYKGDVVGDFEAELLSAGFAIIHDKILIIDPLSDDCVVVTGSHNLGYKASYANDDNLLIIQGNRALAQAYTVHVLDLYDHYRFRAVQQERHAQVGARKFEGFLCRDDSWLDAYRDPAKGALARYFSAA